MWLSGHNILVMTFRSWRFDYGDIQSPDGRFQFCCEL